MLDVTFEICKSKDINDVAFEIYKSFTNSCANYSVFAWINR